MRLILLLRTWFLVIPLGGTVNSAITAEFMSRPAPGAVLHLQPIRVSHSRKHIILAIGVLVLLLLGVAPLVYTASGISPDSLTYPASVLFTILFAIQMWSWH